MVARLKHIVMLCLIIGTQIHYLGKLDINYEPLLINLLYEDLLELIPSEPSLGQGPCTLGKLGVGSLREQYGLVVLMKWMKVQQACFAYLIPHVQKSSLVHSCNTLFHNTKFVLIILCITVS